MNTKKQKAKTLALGGLVVGLAFGTAACSGGTAAPEPGETATRLAGASHSGNFYIVNATGNYKGGGHSEYWINGKKIPAQSAQANRIENPTSDGGSAGRWSVFTSSETCNLTLGIRHGCAAKNELQILPYPNKSGGYRSLMVQGDWRDHKINSNLSFYSPFEQKRDVADYAKLTSGNGSLQLVVVNKGDDLYAVFFTDNSTLNLKGKLGKIVDAKAEVTEAQKELDAELAKPTDYHDFVSEDMKARTRQDLRDKLDRKQKLLTQAADNLRNAL